MTIALLLVAAHLAIVGWLLWCVWDAERRAAYWRASSRKWEALARSGDKGWRESQELMTEMVRATGVNLERELARRDERVNSRGGEG